jgi:hypothetical protein
MNRSYLAFIQTLAKRNPSLRSLAKALSETDRYEKRRKAITHIEFRDERADPFPGQSLEQTLDKISEFQKNLQARDTGLCILVEDIHSSEVAGLGSLLDLDPRFFRDYFATSVFPQLEKGHGTDLMSSLPSRLCLKDVAHFHHQRLIDLGDMPSSRNIPYTLRVAGNLRREVRQLPPLSGRCIGLVRACFSVMLIKLDRGRWICKFSSLNFGTQTLILILRAGLMLMDSTTADVVSTSTDGKYLLPLNFKIKQIPYRNCYKDSESSPAYSSFMQGSSIDISQPMTLIQEVADSLLAMTPQSLKEDLGIVNIAQHPVRIIVSEWTLYWLLMGRYMKLYEFSASTLPMQIANEDPDPIMELYRWRRRSQQSLGKLRDMRCFIMHQPTQSGVSDLLIKDIDYVSDQIEKYRSSLEAMVPILTSTIQLIDSRRAITETLYLKRLTYIALIFLPLSCVSSVFSMSEDFAINSSRFWIYLVTAIPVLAVVLISCNVSFSKHCI